MDEKCKIKYCYVMNTEKDDAETLNVNNDKDIIDVYEHSRSVENDTLFEIMTDKCLPYYDLDKNFKNKKELDEGKVEVFKNCVEYLNSLYKTSDNPDYRLVTYGYEGLKKKWNENYIKMIFAIVKFLKRKGSKSFVYEKAGEKYKSRADEILTEMKGELDYGKLRILTEKDIDKKYWILSVHFIVKGAGYCEKTTDVVFDKELFDKNAYRRTFWKFRLPFSGKYFFDKRCQEPCELKNGKIIYKKIDRNLAYTLKNDMFITDIRSEKGKKCVHVKGREYVKKTSPNLPVKHSGVILPKKKYNREFKMLTDDSLRSLLAVFLDENDEHSVGYSDWTSIIWCLRNEGEKLGDKDKFKNVAKEFSAKYVGGFSNKDLNDKWDEKSDGRVIKSWIGTLIKLACEHDFNKAEAWKISNYKTGFMNLEDGVIADKFIEENGKNFVYYCEHFYLFIGGYWLKTINENPVKDIVSGKMKNKYLVELRKEQDLYVDNEWKMMMKAIKNLANRKKRDDICKIIAEKMELRDDIFDLNNNLLGFINGTIELDTGIFREGRREDFISRVIPYKFKERVEKSEIDKVHTFIRTILPDKDYRDTFLRVISSCLSGDYLRNIVILTGTGANGKDSVMTVLLKMMLGNNVNFYYNNNAVLSEKARTGPQQEKANMSKMRAIVYSEPNSDEHFKCGSLKELTGTGELNARGLHSKNTNLVNCGTHIILANDIPNIDKIDDAIRKRAIIIPFEVSFVEEPDPENKNEKLEKSYYRTKKFGEEYRDGFLQILLGEYKKYCANDKRIEKSPKMKDLVNEYLKDSDKLVTWIDENYEFYKKKIIDGKIDEENEKLKGSYIKLKDIRFDYNVYSREKLTAKEVKSKIMKFKKYRDKFCMQKKYGGKNVKSTIEGLYKNYY